ncbi:hypothetical protein [Burkholderia oklahomensis]|uniref:Uncharacterized protein n=1 Tax=Burkholderia oklahomensis TaxID=342113 RepID=A0AAI8B6X2_9BURK|nr:hypothetical protein [Burkholderia oklahomensis]AIO66584.1 hypothetical protein DM82_19 [Burkholderia oklahomensis]AJX32792.1 hypothetical protein BG90_1002 [Burkholderia oklahomensis C6786]AOI43560.1 hypothetical protein WG70_29235 [Burkholderia oklahomensis EO147]AOI47127.1 hypothetical protein WI23_15820 [Burkholderia oklahomensis C6786]KUY49203.1 hypothetical protein WG70_19285 [Burkholderia oklahomensis EO147]
MNQDLLAHIRADQLDGSIFNASGHSVTIGPVTLEFRVSGEPASATAELYIARQLIGGCTLNPAHPSGKFGGAVDKLKSEVDLTLDVPGKKLDYRLTVCAPIIGGTSKSGTLGL